MSQHSEDEDNSVSHDAYISEGEELTENYKPLNLNKNMDSFQEGEEAIDHFDYGEDSQQPRSPPLSEHSFEEIQPAEREVNQTSPPASPAWSSPSSPESQTPAQPVTALEGLDEEALREKYRQLQAALENDDLEEGAEPTFEGFEAQDIPASPGQSGDEMELEREEEFTPYSPLSHRSNSNVVSQTGVRPDDHVTDIFGASDESDGEQGSFEGFNQSDIEESEQALDSRKQKFSRSHHSDLGEEDSDEKEIFGAPDEVEEQQGLKRKRILDSGDEDGESIYPHRIEDEAILPTLTDDEDDDDQTGADQYRRGGKNSAEGGPAGGHEEEAGAGPLSDFEEMMAKKKAERRLHARRRRRDVDFINDSDDMINALIVKMKVAWEEDRLRNSRKEPAFKKLQLLPIVISHLKKFDLQTTFLDSGILSAFSDWLQPLPDRSLPHLQIREEILKILLELPPVDVTALKSSFIGKSVMYLYKHPKETKENRRRAGKLINEWSRSIFNIPTDYKALSREEREERDFSLNRAKKLAPKSISEQGTRPGEKGFIGRARVPQPSTQDYVVRPKPKVSMAEFNQRRSAPTKSNRLDKLRKIMVARKVGSKTKGTAEISIEGRKLSL